MYVNAIVVSCHYSVQLIAVRDFRLLYRSAVMRLKLTKLKRYWSARLKSQECLPLFWHVGKPNFGDDINPLFFELLADQRFRLAVDQSQPHFLGMGSVLQASTSSSVVLGSGLLKPEALVRPQRIVSVRGDLTRQALGAADVMLGDPMVLIDRLVKPDGGDCIGFIPHVTELRELRRRLPSTFRLIDVTGNPWEVVREIGECRIVFSQSLHGLIVADAFQIPNIWIAPSNRMLGGAFKFQDYFTTLDHAKTSHALTEELLTSPPFVEASVGQYRGNKKEYHEVLAAALRDPLKFSAG